MMYGSIPTRTARTRENRRPAGMPMTSASVKPEKQNRGVEKLRPCTPVGQENGESSHGLREGHQERRARAAPGNFPDGKTGEQARQRNGRARQLVRSHAAPVPGLPASH